MIFTFKNLLFLKKNFYCFSGVFSYLFQNIKTPRGGIHPQGATLNVNITLGKETLNPSP